MRRILPVLLFALAANAPLAAQGEKSFDHSKFDALLGAHVSEDGLVDYSGFDDSPDFQHYLTSLVEAQPEALSEPEQLAFWINSYNAYTIELINRHQEKKSIRNINKTLGFFSGKGPWKERFAEVAGEEWTLDEIEHEVIRKRFFEPRIHFALVCAALGCPPLLPEAYTGAELGEQLDGRVRVFLLESPGKNRVVPGEGMVYLSPIFDWYRDDFPPGTPGLGLFLAQYYPPGPERTLLESGQFQIDHTDYDWKLNAQALEHPGSGNSSAPGRIPF